MFIICALLIGCTPNDGGTSVAAIKAIRIHESSPNTFAIDETLNLSEVKIIVEYKNGETAIVDLSETMIDDADRVKFNIVSSSTTVVVNYGGRSVPFRFSVTETRQERKYNVHFESNGGTTIPSQYVNVVETFTLPIKQGYVFLGWYDNVDCAGIQARAPYEVSRNMTFFAKWEDSRRYSVEFLDFNKNVIPVFTQTIIHGENVLSLPEGPRVTGYDFVRWRGQTENITSNVQIEAEYKRLQCNVNFYFNYDSETPDKRPQTISYGDPFPTSLIPPFIPREGYTGNWYILNDNEQTEPIFNSQGVVITEKFASVTKDIDIIPVYQIIRLKVTFQDDERFKNTGTSWTSIVKEVDYGSNFSLTAGDNSDITYPLARTGHTTEWAVRIDQKWINVKNGSEWDNDEWEWLPLSIPLYSIDYKNIAGETTAVIKNGINIENIKSDITIQAKYVRNKYELIFRRPGTSEYLYRVINVKYGTKFSLYRPEGQPNSQITYGTMSKQDFVMYNSLADWNIEWYPNVQFNPSDIVNFDDENYITISSDRTLYCKDIDKRTYQVEFWDWNFNTNSAVLMSVSVFNGNEWEDISTQTVSHGGEPYIPTPSSKLAFGYEFVDPTNFWYDAPHDKGYARQVYPSGITKSMKFYARYRIRTFSLTFKDYFYPYINGDDFTVIRNLPNVTYNKDEFGNDLPTGYLPMEAVYFRDFGYLFTENEIYYGGDDVYSARLFIEEYQSDYSVYDNYRQNIETIKVDIEYYQGLLDEIQAYEASVLSYTTTAESTQRYNEIIGDYDLYRDNLYTAEQKLNFYNDYKIQYYQGGDEIPAGAVVGDIIPNTGNREKQYNLLMYGLRDDNGNFMKDQNGNYVYNTDIGGNFVENGDYQRYCNLFYETADRPGYVFDGWFTSPNFNVNTKISSYNELNNLITEIEVSINLTLYAKWIDLEKGTDGLIFEFIEEYDEVEEEYVYYYQVIDYLSQDQFNNYTIININGIYHYKNADGSIVVPVNNLSYNAFSASVNELTSEIRFPSFHEGLPVRRIQRTIFVTNFDKVQTIDIPKNIRIIEEGSFSPCNNLELLTISDDNSSFIIRRGVLYTHDGSTLVCYPAKNIIEEYLHQPTGVIVPSSTFIVPSTVSRIANGAFAGCNALRYVAFEGSAIELSIGQKAFSGLTYLRGIGNMLISQRLIDGTEDYEDIIISDFFIPDRLISIGARAFENCLSLMNIEATVSSQLIYVGENALSTSGWYIFNKNVQNSTYLDGSTSGGILMLGYVAVTTTKDFTGTEIILSSQYVRAIADAAFNGRSSLNYVQILNPDFVYIGERAFNNCTNLNRIDIYNPNPCEIGALAFGGVGSLTIFVPNTVGTVDAYKNAPQWSYYANFIEAM